MKKVILIALALLSIYGCKKGQPIEPIEPLPEPNHLTAVVQHGKTFTADSFGTSVNILSPGLYFLTGTSTASAGSPSISLSGKVKTGTYTFGTLPANETQTATYEINKVKYKAISGTMVILAIDTLQVLKRLEATFSFKTDTVKGVSYDVTEGNLYFTEK
jgi:hypothetical protein